MSSILFGKVGISNSQAPETNGPQAPDVPDLAQTIKPLSDLFKIFTDVFARA